MSFEEPTFDDFRLSRQDETYAVRQLDSNHRIRLPDLSSTRWIPGRNDIDILHLGKGEVNAHLSGENLSVENSAVRVKREGVAQGMMGYLFAVALANGAKHVRGVASSRGIIGMYAKMVGVDNLELGETSARSNDFDTVMESLAAYPVNDNYCTYGFELRSLACEYVAALPTELMADPVMVPAK